MTKFRKSNRRIQGTNSEETAIHYFEKKGYQVLEKNFRLKIGEIDLIFEKNSVLLFVEVRSSEHPEFELPYGIQALMPTRKIQQFRKLVQVFLDWNPSGHDEIEMVFLLVFPDHEFAEWPVPL